MAHYVTCVYCKQRFDRDKIPFAQVSQKRYAHKDCFEREEAKKTQEEIEKDKLFQYIIKLFKLKYVDPKIQKQVKQYVDDYNFTYSGIRKALVYFFEIKGNSIAKSNGGIGIVPYVYKEAYTYYRALWEAKQINDDKNIEDYIPKVEEITIPRPQRNIKKRKLFSFLDEENEDVI